ncbi:hypothetical protein BGW80DRAFT_717316 [Lactifluus volemus]|nr:hypothetical protein BGW80DRAFT_717316 [Lactifluus volemus]
MKEDQLLLLTEKSDDDWWKVKQMGVSDVQGGLVPSAYVELVSARWTMATWIHSQCVR